MHPPDFKTIQIQLAAHFRDPKNNPPPAGLENRRLDIYRSLFFNNIVGFISSGFPVLRKFYNEEAWRQLIRQFYSRHKSHSPYFAEISKEFVKFLTDEYQLSDNDPPFIAELAHYEWAELALSIDKASIDWNNIEKSKDFLNHPIVVSPLAWRFSYHWPVHQLSPDYRPETPLEEPIYLILCRNSNDKINFIEINPVTEYLLQTLEENPDKKGSDNIKASIQAIQLPDNNTTMQGALQTLESLFDQEVILGVRTNHAPTE